MLPVITRLLPVNTCYYMIVTCFLSATCYYTFITCQYLLLHDCYLFLKCYPLLHVCYLSIPVITCLLPLCQMLPVCTCLLPVNTSILHVSHMFPYDYQFVTHKMIPVSLLPVTCLSFDIVTCCLFNTRLLADFNLFISSYQFVVTC